MHSVRGRSWDVPMFMCAHNEKKRAVHRQHSPSRDLKDVTPANHRGVGKLTMANLSAGQSDRVGKTAKTPAGTEDETTAKSPTGESTMPRKDKVRGWSRKDVSRWLEKRNLVKFVPLFLKNSIVGADLAESRLSFLYDEEVTVEDREQLLAEIYMLLHPDSPKLLRRSPPSPSLRAIHPKDREKYEAALQVAKSLPSNSSVAPVVVIGPRSRSPAATSPSSTTLTLPTSKPRSRSESGLETEGSGMVTPPSPGRKYLKRKSTPAVHDYLQRGTVQNASLYETFQTEAQVCLHCVQVQRSEVGSKFGFSYQTLPDSCLLVTNIRPCSSLPLQIGDRILEVNGILLPGHKGSPLETVLSKSASLDVVLVRHQPSAVQERQDSRTSANPYEKLEQELVMGEVRWQSLRQLLTSLQHKSFDPMTLTGALTRVEDMEDIRKGATLELEVEELQRTCSELSSKVNSLQATLKTKDQELALVTKERDRAVDTLRTRLLNKCTPPPRSSGRRHRAGHEEDDEDDDLPKRTRAVRNSQDLHAVFFEHIDVSLATMETSNATKEDVLAVLRELTQASRRHAQFVDRLIAFVSERAPWMLDELNALQDASELPDPPAAQPTALTSSPPLDCDAERVIVV